MPKQIQCISIFVSCPSNMSGYISRVEDVVDGFNNIFGFSRGIIFRTIYWRKNVIGQVTQDPQAAINSQLLGDFDLMIALIGDRLGDATARAESGTAEEIEIALEKVDNIFKGKHVQVMFRSRLDVNIRDLDLDQLQKVKDFKSSIYKKALVVDFDEDNEIDGIVNRFLESACRDLEASHSTMKNPPDISISKEYSSLQNEEIPSADIVIDGDKVENLGFYDELEVANEAISEQALEVSEFGRILSDMTADIKRILGSYDDTQQKKRFDELGDMLASRAEIMNLITGRMQSNLERHSISFENVLLMLEEFDQDGNKEGISSLKDSLVSASASMSEFLRESIIAKEATEKSPRATQKFNHGKRSVVKAMGNVIDVVQLSVNRFNEYASYLNSLL